jgi:predicted DsbA family dithiol-disulfide isomerase
MTCCDAAHKRGRPARCAAVAVAAADVLPEITVSTILEAAWNGMPQPLLVYTDYVAPACYLMEAVLADVDGVAIERHPFELFPAPLPLPDYGTPAEIEAWDATVAPLAERLDLPLRRPRRAVRTRKAHEAVLFARMKGAGVALHRAVFQAYFVDGVDIARVDVLVRLGEGAGLDRSEMKVALDLDTYADAVMASRAAALQAGISAAPAIVAERHGRRRALVGFHDRDALRAWLDHDEPSRRPGT